MRFKGAYNVLPVDKPVRKLCKKSGKRVEAAQLLSQAVCHGFLGLRPFFAQTNRNAKSSYI